MWLTFRNLPTRPRVLNPFVERVPPLKVFSSVIVAFRHLTKCSPICRCFNGQRIPRITSDLLGERKHVPNQLMRLENSNDTRFQLKLFPFPSLATLDSRRMVTDTTFLPAGEDLSLVNLLGISNHSLQLVVFLLRLLPTNPPTPIPRSSTSAPMGGFPPASLRLRSKRRTLFWRSLILSQCSLNSPSEAAQTLERTDSLGCTKT